MGDVFKFDIVWTSDIDKCSVQRGVHQSMPGTASIETSAQPDISIIGIEGGRKVSLKECTFGRMKDLLKRNCAASVPISIFMCL
jgi:hypothetical protein